MTDHPERSWYLALPPGIRKGVDRSMFEDVVCIPVDSETALGWLQRMEQPALQHFGIDVRLLEAAAVKERLAEATRFHNMLWRTGSHPAQTHVLLHPAFVHRFSPARGAGSGTVEDGQLRFSGTDADIGTWTTPILRKWNLADIAVSAAPAQRRGDVLARVAPYLHDDLIEGLLDRRWVRFGSAGGGGHLHTIEPPDLAPAQRGEVLAHCDDRALRARLIGDLGKPARPGGGRRR